MPENGTPSRLRVRHHYLATIKVRFGSRPEDVANLQRVFVRAGRNLFDDFFFGTQPITEYAPGPEMYVDGSVYVGGDLYTPNDTLHFLQNVTFTGNHVLDFRPNDPHRVAPTIDGDGVADNWSPSNPPRQGQEQKLLDTESISLDPNFLDDPIANDTDSDGNRNNDGYHELIETAVPGPDPLQLDASTSERLVNAADYRIFVDANNAVKIYSGASPTPLASGPVYTALSNLITTNQALKDVREKDYVRVATLDVNQIKVAFDQGILKDTVGNGDGLLLYVADTSSGNPVSTKVVDSATGTSTTVNSTHSRGVRLKNGGLLPNAGLTIASPNAVYVQGDYNSGQTGSVEPASNTAANYTPPTDRPSPFVSNYDHAPAAIIGDAVNILSNAWNDANSLLPQASRRAESSTVNAAIVAGNVPTTTTSYSGGIENFVRFHENWDSRYFTISGALAQLYASEQARGLWKDADYTPPARRWYYDDLLRDRNPPGMRAGPFLRARRMDNAMKAPFLKAALAAGI